MKTRPCGPFGPGVGIVEAFGQLNARLEREHGIQLHCPVGIHTGLVVAGDIASDAGLETMAAIGDAPNVAARLQSLAERDTVVISAATYQLIAGYFNCRELGFRTLKGISEPMPIYEVLNERHHAAARVVSPRYVGGRIRSAGAGLSAVGASPECGSRAAQARLPRLRRPARGQELRRLPQRL